MMKFHYREALTPVLLMNFVQSQLQRDVRIGVYTHFLKDRNCEICKKGPKLQGLRAEDAKAKPYLELTILVT